MKAATWPRNAVDSFVLARLEAEGLRPSPEADKVTLLRRATLDLTGLPPSPPEVASFLADRSPDAYEKAVDRLLAELWDALTDAQYLRVYVRQLRQKVETDPERPQYILTETGIGYRLRSPD